MQWLLAGSKRKVGLVLAHSCAAVSGPPVASWRDRCIMQLRPCERSGHGRRSPQGQTTWKPGLGRYGRWMGGRAGPFDHMTRRDKVEPCALPLALPRLAVEGFDVVTCERVLLVSFLNGSRFASVVLMVCVRCCVACSTCNPTRAAGAAPFFQLLELMKSRSRHTYTGSWTGDCSKEQYVSYFRICGFSMYLDCNSPPPCSMLGARS